ncbi:MAG: hypothetical protein ACR2J4_09865 [Deinococcus sp.]
MTGMKRVSLAVTILSLLGSSLALLDRREVVGTGYGFTGCHAAAAWDDLWADSNHDYYCITRSDGSYTLMVYISE